LRGNGGSGQEWFVWLLEHDTQESFEEPDAAYYASAERLRLQRTLPG
jgi:hypothetical protein